MICQFTVKNYKSIKDEMTLDLQGANISEHTDQVIVDVDNEVFLPTSVIYGPNGAGKSNILEALEMLVLKVLKPLYATYDSKDNLYLNKRVQIEPFAFDLDTVNSPTEFELFFRTNLAEYRYILNVYKDNVIYERLDRKKLDTKRTSFLYERNDNEIILKGDFTKLKISDDLSRTLPLISYLGITYNENEVVRDVVDWFKNKIYFLNYSKQEGEFTLRKDTSSVVHDLMLKMIKEMDLDIVDFRIDDNDDDNIKVYTKHNVLGFETELDLLDESRGTRKLFGLLPHIVSSILDGKVLVVDELDSKLHPMLLRYIIMLFNNLDVNKNNAQLIFTSHDLSTMNNEVFRRDEIWFVAKGNKENSMVYSLVEFKSSKGESVRKDAKYDKQYLEGKYGADPYLKKIINWSEVNGQV